jgi:C4-dicarboxylate transporter, DctQ subunit
MAEFPSAMARWLRRRAENVAAILLATVFVSFAMQIIYRYLLGWPVGWTIEVSTLAWMWLVLWGAAFIVGEQDEIRFDIIYSVVSNRTRRVLTLLTSGALIILFTVSYPAVIDYVTFMRVERASYIDVRLDYLFSVYLLFAAAAIVRHLWLCWRAVRGDLPSPGELR